MAAGVVTAHMEPGGHETNVERRPPAGDDALVTVIVEYPTGTDRCTIYPAGSTATERLTRWLSADWGAVESLERRR